MQFIWFGYSLGAVYLPFRSRALGTGELLCPNWIHSRGSFEGVLVQFTPISVIFNRSREH